MDTMKLKITVNNTICLVEGCLSSMPTMSKFWSQTQAADEQNLVTVLEHLPKFSPENLGKIKYLYRLYAFYFFDF